MRPSNLIVAFSMILLPSVALAQWESDGTPICVAAEMQSSYASASDGAGGVIIAWEDRRSGTFDIYVQRIDRSGVVRWTLDGVPLCSAPNSQGSPTIVASGNGGAIVAWDDFRNGSHLDIYVQRVNASGTPLWTADGVALCAAAGNQRHPSIVSDGTNGAIVAWEDGRADAGDVFARRVNVSGVPQWAADGVALCTAPNAQNGTRVVSDGANGAIVAWNDGRNGSSDVFARRVNASGVPQWTGDGVALCTAPNIQGSLVLVSDGAGGAIAAWTDYRGAATDIYARRVNSAGTALWTPDGVAVCSATNNQQSPAATADGAGGIIVAWHDLRSGSSNDIYAQRVSDSGAPRWVINGIGVATGAESQTDVAIVTDAAGGAVVTWLDFRSGPTCDIYAQRLTSNGASAWTLNGVALSTAPENQEFAILTSDGAGSAIATWQDYRNTGFLGPPDLFAQRVEYRYGAWGQPEPILDSAADNPSDQGGKVVLNWTASGRDVLNQKFIQAYTIWRALDVVAGLPPGDGAAVVDRPTARSAKPGERVVWREHTSATEYYWELIGSQEAHYDAGYSYLAPTRQDSVLSNPATHYFRVVAEGPDLFDSWPSNTLSAHSVDNLAPAAPLLLTAQRVGSDVNLRWNRTIAPDLRDYSVYRKTSSGVTPVPVNFLAASDDTVLIDASAPTSALYYIVTAYDVHANQSPPSNEAHVGALTGIGNTPPITALTVLENMPNPFNERTTLRIGLPKASDVKIEVFDVAGRRVRELALARQEKGWQSVSFDGRDDRGRPLASGVYLYRVKANGETTTKKMVITH